MGNGEICPPSNAVIGIAAYNASKAPYAIATVNITFRYG